MKKSGRICYEVFSILGALLGAGFISGAEVVTFFGRFGYFGLLGIILSSTIFGVIISKSNNKSNTKNKYNFFPYCQLAISGSMFAGVVQVLSQTIKINQYLVCALVLILLVISLIIGIKFANIFNVFVTIATILILPFVIKNTQMNYYLLPTLNLYWLPVYGVLYSIMNAVACMPIIKAINKKDAKIVAFFCTIITIILLVIMFLLSANNNADMPVLMGITNATIKAIYSIIFMFAMTSTMLSASSGTKQIFAKFGDNKFSSLCSAIAICAISFIGFGKIINYVYPLIGAVIILQYFLNKMHKNKEKTQKNTKQLKFDSKF